MRHLFLLLPLFLSTQAMAGMYRWVDAQGNVTYSQTPPPDARELKAIPPPPPPAEDPQAARKRLDAQIEKLNNSAEERRKAEQVKQQQKQEAEARKRDCETARRNLRTLQSRPPNTLYRTGEDQYRRFTPEELEQKTMELQKIIDKHCK